MRLGGQRSTPQAERSSPWYSVVHKSLTRSTGKGFNTMCKKIGIAAVAVVAGLLVLNHTKLGSWAKYAFHSIKKQVEDSVPPEVEIAKLKSELASFGPKVHEHINKMAEDKTAVTKLEKD